MLAQRVALLQQRLDEEGADGIAGDTADLVANRTSQKSSHIP